MLRLVGIVDRRVSDNLPTAVDAGGYALVASPTKRSQVDSAAAAAAEAV